MDLGLSGRRYRVSHSASKCCNARLEGLCKRCCHAVPCCHASTSKVQKDHEVSCIIIYRSIMINIIDPLFARSLWFDNAIFSLPPPYVHHSTGIWTNRSSFVSWNEVPNAWLFWAWKIWARQVTSQRLRRFLMKKLVLVFVRRGFCEGFEMWFHSSVIRICP